MSVRDFIETLPDAEQFYEARRGTREQGNLQRLLANDVVVIPSVVPFAKHGVDSTVGAYSSFVFLEECEGANQVLGSLDALTGELSQSAGKLFVVPHRLLHFYTHIHTVPVEQGGVIHSPELVERMIDCTREIFAGCSPFEVQYKGVVGTRDAVLLCGYGDKRLDKIRETYFQAMLEHPGVFYLPKTGGTDARASVQWVSQKLGRGVAAVTAARIIQPSLRDPQKYVGLLEQKSDVVLGTTYVDHVIFTCNNGWYDVRNSAGNREQYREVRIQIGK